MEDLHIFTGWFINNERPQNTNPTKLDMCIHFLARILYTLKRMSNHLTQVQLWANENILATGDNLEKSLKFPGFFFSQLFWILISCGAWTLLVYKYPLVAASYWNFSFKLKMPTQQILFCKTARQIFLYLYKTEYSIFPKTGWIN